MARDSELAKLPSTVTLGPFRYDVTADGDAAYDYDFLGICLNRSRRIKIDPRQSETELPQTLLHEILHAIGATWEIDIVRAHTIDQNTHKVTDKIDLLASALLQFLRANPEVVAYLTENANLPVMVQQTLSVSVKSPDVTP